MLNKKVKTGAMIAHMRGHEETQDFRVRDWLQFKAGLETQEGKKKFQGAHVQEVIGIMGLEVRSESPD